LFTVSHFIPSQHTFTQGCGMREISGRIVIVDDMSDLGEIMAEYLHLVGFGDIEVYNTPRNALEAIRGNTRPAIVITDYNMPGMSGLELLKEIDQHHSGINGIIITGNSAEAQSQSHGYTVIEKGNSFNPLADHITRIFKAHLVPLLAACPCARESPSCPLYAARRLTQPELVAWLVSLSPGAGQAILRAHESCCSSR